MQKGGGLLQPSNSSSPAVALAQPCMACARGRGKARGREALRVPDEEEADPRFLSLHGGQGGGHRRWWSAWG